MILQSKRLSMLGLGIVDDKDIVDGIHLRWLFDPALGFPKYGFTLYRREHTKCPLRCFPEEHRWENESHPSPWKTIDDITFESKNNIQERHYGGIVLPHLTSLKIRLPETSDRVELTICAREPISLEISIYFAEQVIETTVKELRSGTNRINISSDAIESVEIKIVPSEIKFILSETECSLSTICWNDLSQFDSQPEWQKIAELCLPVTHGDYPCHHGHSDDWEAAKIRLDSMKEGKYDERIFEEGLKPYLEELVKEELVGRISIPQSERVKDEKYHLSVKDIDGELEATLNRGNIPERLKQEFELNGVFFSENATVTEETSKWRITDNRKNYVVKKRDDELHADAKVMQLQPLQMVLLSALDPGIAQMLGLYYINLPIAEDGETGVEEETAYDYKIVGCWTKVGRGQRYENARKKRCDMYSFDFSSIHFDNPQRTFQKYGFSFESDSTISTKEGSYGVHGEWSIKIPESPLKINFPRPMSMLDIEIGPPRWGFIPMWHPAITIILQKGDGSSESFDFSTLYISKIFEDYNTGITSIEISIGDSKNLDFYLFKFSYAEMDYAWIRADIKLEKRKKIDKPAGLQAYLLPGRSVVKREEHTERVIYAPAAVGLKWNLAAVKMTKEIADNTHTIDVVSEDTHVLYKIERQPLGKNENPGPINNTAFKIINNETPVLVPRLPEGKDKQKVVPDFPPEWPPQTGEEREQGVMPVFYLDAGEKDEKGILEEPLEKDMWYAYRITGIDIFGRHSTPCEPVQIQLEDRFPPPPSPLVISAKFLDPKDPYLHLEESKDVTHADITETPVWNKERKEWEVVGKENRKGVKVIWKWPENFRIQAPDAEKFRVYFKPGLLNVVEGTVKEVTCFDESDHKGLHLKGEIKHVNEAANEITLKIKTEEEREIDTDTDSSNRFFKYNRSFFRIVDIVQSTFVAPEPDEDETKGTQEIVFRIENEIEITIETTEESGKSGVFDVDYSRVEVYFDNDVDIERNSFAGRVLRQRGKNFVIIKNMASKSILDSSENPAKKAIFRVQNLTRRPREIPEMNKPASFLIDSTNPLFMNYSRSGNWITDGWDGEEVGMNEGAEQEETIIDKWGKEKRVTYRLFKKFIPEESIPRQYRLSPDAQEPMVSGNIGITTIDDSGNEGSVSPPQPVFAVLRDKPITPDTPDISELWATVPDYYGTSHFDVTWPVNEKVYFYQVYRTMDKTLMLVDRDEHREGGHGANGELPPEIVAQIEILDEKISAWDAPDDQKQKRLTELIEAYGNLRNDTWQYLAGLPKNEKAFSPVSSPLDPLSPENWKDGNMFFEDSIAGKGRNCYFYRIGAMDKAGNRSSLGPSTPPVKVPDVIPPKPPVITKALGGNRKAVVRWRRSTEPGMARYKLYRTDKKEDAADVRLMGEPTVINADAAGMPIRAQVIKSSGYVDVPFIPNAQAIHEVYQVNEEGESISEENSFGGWKSLTLKVSIDEGSVDIQYRDTGDHERTKRHKKAFKGQVKVDIGNGERPIASITGVYRESEPSEDVFDGISSGKIMLQAEDVSSLKGANMAVSYTDTSGDSQVTHRVPYLLEYSDENLEAGAYYYRIVALRESVIGEQADGSDQTLELPSPPTKSIAVKVFDNSPPEPPEWERVEWIKLDDEGNEHSWEEEVENYKPAVVLEWAMDHPKFSCLIQRREQGETFWKSISSWLKGQNRFIDEGVHSNTGYQYQIKVKNKMGFIENSTVSNIDPINHNHDE